MRNSSLIPLAIICGSFLSACGGGGSSSSASNVTLDGTFSKGLYANAEVQAYEVVNGTLVALGAKTITDEKGAYSLSLKATTNPVVVEMTTTNATTMLDEVDGFASVTPKAGTKIRSMVYGLSTSTSVHGNLFTEMAVDGASKANGGLTQASIAAAKALVQQATGIDPFTTKPTGSVSETMDSNQEKLMTLQTAMMLEAKSIANTCTADNTTGVACLVMALNAKGALSKASDTYSVTDANGLKTFLTAKVANLEGYTLPAGASQATKTFVSNMKSKAPVVKAGFVEPTSISGSAATDRQGLDAFLQVMRSGFNEAEKTITARKNSVKQRFDQYVFEHVGDGLKILNQSLSVCSTTSGALVCDVNAGSIFKAATSGYSFTYDVTSDGYRAPTYGPAVYTIAGTIAGTDNAEAGSGNAVITATKTLKAGSKLWSEMVIDVSASGIKKNTLSASVEINKFTIKAFDQATNSSKWALLTMSGINLSGARPSAEGLATLTLTAPLTLTTSDGDSIGGKINTLTIKEKVINKPAIGDRDVYPVYLDAVLDTAFKEGALIGMSITASQNIDNFNPDLPSTSANAANGYVSGSFKLSDRVSILFTASKTSFDKSNLAVKIISNGNWLNIAGNLQRSNPIMDDESLTGDLVVTSSGSYNAKIRKDASKQVVGEVFNGTQQIGTIENGIVKVSGVEVSLR